MDTLQTDKSDKRKKGIYIGAPACFALELVARQVSEAFMPQDEKGLFCGGIYVVGSCLERSDWRDIDVRFIMSDEGFAHLFPNAGDNWELDTRWLLMTTAISQYMSKMTDLPVDFQFQPQSHANERHKGDRSALGIRINR